MGYLKEAKVDCFREVEVQVGSFLIFGRRIVSFAKITFHGISLVTSLQ